MGLRPYRDENTKFLQGKAKKISRVEAVTEYKVIQQLSLIFRTVTQQPAIRNIVDNFVE